MNSFLDITILFLTSKNSVLAPVLFSLIFMTNDFGRRFILLAPLYLRLLVGVTGVDLS